MVWVPLDLGVEEVDGAFLSLQEQVGIIEVLPRLRDHPPGVVVKLLVLVTGDDMARLEGFHPIYRVPPWSQTSDGHTRPEVHVNAVVDHISGDYQPKVRDV